MKCDRRLCAFLEHDRAVGAHRIKRFSRGDRIDDLNGSDLKFWVVVSGTAGVCTTFPDGRRQIHSLESEGDTVCGLNFANQYGYWLEALDDCEVCTLDFNPDTERLTKDPEFLRFLIEVASHRLDTTSRHIATLGRLDSTERVLVFLAEMAVKANYQTPMSPVRLQISREDIADYLGLNSETVSRVLGRIKKTGIVRFLSPTEFVVPDLLAIERRLPVQIPQRQTTSRSHVLEANTSEKGIFL